MLLYLGIEIPKIYDNPTWSRAFLEWLKNIKWEYRTGESSMKSKLKILQLLHEEQLEIGRELRSYCRENNKADYDLLRSIPGIGSFLAAALLAELGDIRRFSNEKQFSSYIGMIPGIQNSGETERHMGVTPRCNGLLRSYLIEASWIAVRKDPEMQAYYRKHIGANVNCIIVKVAHKLIKRILSVIKNERPYQINYQLTSTT